jgi:hypothetical protein
MQTKTEKQSGALARLKAQLKSGVKMDQETRQIIPLTEKDKSRVLKEIKVLEQRLHLTKTNND